MTNWQGDPGERTSDPST